MRFKATRKWNQPTFKWYSVQSGGFTSDKFSFRAFCEKEGRGRFPWVLFLEFLDPITAEHYTRISELYWRCLFYPRMLHEYGKYALNPSRLSLDHEWFLRTDIQVLRTNLTSRMELGSTLFKTKENALEPFAHHTCSHNNENWEKICVNET